MVATTEQARLLCLCLSLLLYSCITESSSSLEGSWLLLVPEWYSNCNDVCCSDDRWSRVVRSQVFPVVRSVADARQTFSGAYLWQQQRFPGSCCVSIWMRSANISDGVDHACCWRRRESLVWSELCCSASNSGWVLLCWRNRAATSVKSGMDLSVISPALVFVRSGFKTVAEKSFYYSESVGENMYSNWSWVIDKTYLFLLCHWSAKQLSNILHYSCAWS